jgi:sialate O-acetylesterase
MTLSLKNTGMAVITDIGNPTDIHPRNKQDVGKRLALSALKVAYKKNIVHSGPVYKSMRQKDGGVELRFDSVGGGLEAMGGEMLKDFIIAGEDQKFVKASAKITGKSTVLVSSPDVTDPAAVRFGWQDVPEGNLFNSAGLPASPFRTDDWIGETAGNK